MSTIELDARRMELIRKIMETDSIEVLDKVKQSFNRAVKQNIEAFEADLDADILETVSHQDVMKDVRQMLVSL